MIPLARNSWAAPAVEHADDVYWQVMYNRAGNKLQVKLSPQTKEPLGV